MIINSTSINGTSALQSQQSGSATHAVAATQSANVNSGANTAQSTNSAAYSVQISAQGLSQNKSATNTGASNGSSNTISQASLMQYNDSQLKQMLSSNKITQSQYNIIEAERNHASEQDASSKAASEATTNMNSVK